MQETKTVLSSIPGGNKSRMQDREEAPEMEKLANLICHYVLEK